MGAKTQTQLIADGDFEMCSQCDEPTGRAGRDEDSIFFDTWNTRDTQAVGMAVVRDEVGPLCESCLRKYFVCNDCGIGILRTDYEGEDIRADRKRLTAENAELKAKAQPLRIVIEDHRDLRFERDDGSVIPRSGLGEWIQLDDNGWAFRMDSSTHISKGTLTVFADMKAESAMLREALERCVRQMELEDSRCVEGITGSFLSSMRAGAAVLAHDEGEKT